VEKILIIVYVFKMYINRITLKLFQITHSLVIIYPETTQPNSHIK
ncbi:MAG: hypothetical protein ucyna2_01201, partial [Candidatus Atelocyanobacterium thalassa isolate SIO64986]